MRLTPSTLLAAGTLLCLGGACAKVNESGTSKGNGQLNILTHTQVSTAANQNTSENDICATFTLTPYAPTSSTTIAQAGTPVTFTTSNTSSATDQILGCIDSTTDYSFPEVDGGSDSENWGYLVSATNFVYCNPDAGTLDPTTVDPAPAYYAAVNCQAGQDTTLTIDYPISISSADNGGYVDISAGVTATTQYTGCKQAEIDSTGTLYFGESNTIDALNSVPLGLVGFETTDTPSDVYLQQFGGQVSAPDPTNSGATLYDTYYAGQFAASSTGNPALPSAILQTFLTDATEANLFDGGTTNCDEWTDSQHAMCMTTMKGTMQGLSPTTTGSLADAFIFVPGNGTKGGGYAAASVADSTDITLYSQSWNFSPNSANDYTSASATPANATMTENASPGFSSNAGSISPQAGFNDNLNVQDISAPSGDTFTGVYISLQTNGQFIVTLNNGTSNVWTTLDGSTGVWALGTTLSDISTAPAGTGQQTVGCLTIDSDSPPVNCDSLSPGLYHIVTGACAAGSFDYQEPADYCSVTVLADSAFNAAYNNYLTGFVAACGGCTAGLCMPASCFTDSGALSSNCTVPVPNGDGITVCPTSCAPAAPPQ